MGIKKKIIVYAMSTVASVLLVMLLLFQGFTGSVQALPSTIQTSHTVNGTPTAIPGVTITGTYLRIGVNEGGTFGVGNGSDPGTGFQYPIGPQYESLAIWWWGEGYVVAYKTYDGEKWVDNIAYWQPGYGWPPPKSCNLYPVSFAVTRRDDNFVIVRIVLKTLDNVLRLVFEFNFPLAQKYVNVRTAITNIGKGPVRDIVYKRFVDWDVHQSTYNYWSTDSHSVYAAHYNETAYLWYEMSVSGALVEYPKRWISYSEIYGWDDYTSRGPGMTIQSHGVEVLGDGAAMLTFDFQDEYPPGGIGQAKLMYQGSENWWRLPPS